MAPEGGGQFKILKPQAPNPNRSFGMTDSSLAQILASASYDDSIKLYLDDPTDDWFCAATLTGHESTVWSLAWEPEQGRYLASASDDHTIRIWRRLPEQGELKFNCVAVLDGHDRSIFSISWTKSPPPKNKLEKEGHNSLGWIASTGGDGMILVWELTVSHYYIRLYVLFLPVRRRLLKTLKLLRTSSTLSLRNLALHTVSMT